MFIAERAQNGTVMHLFVTLYPMARKQPPRCDTNTDFVCYIPSGKGLLPFSTWGCGGAAAMRPGPAYHVPGCGPGTRH